MAQPYAADSGRRDKTTCFFNSLAARTCLPGFAYPKINDCMFGHCFDPILSDSDYYVITRPGPLRSHALVNSDVA